MLGLKSLGVESGPFLLSCKCSFSTTSFYLLHFTQETAVNFYLLKSLKDISVYFWTTIEFATQSEQPSYVRVIDARVGVCVVFERVTFDVQQRLFVRQAVCRTRVVRRACRRRKRPNEILRFCLLKRYDAYCWSFCLCVIILEAIWLTLVKNDNNKDLSYVREHAKSLIFVN
jgi:hypothetical protein